jgi:hypothetical protein
LDHGHDGEYEYEMGNLDQPLTADDSNNSGATSMSSHIDEFSIRKVHQLGEGAYGGVWQGLLLPENKPVAIKIIFA